MSSCDVIVEQEEIKTAPKIPDTLKIHKFVRSMEKGKDPSFHFYYLASDDDPFHVQSYPSPSLLECKHMIQEAIDEHFCISCRNRYSNTDTSDWLKCAVCKQWFNYELTILHFLYYFFQIITYTFSDDNYSSKKKISQLIEYYLLKSLIFMLDGHIIKCLLIA